MVFGIAPKRVGRESTRDSRPKIVEIEAQIPNARDQWRGKVDTRFVATSLSCPRAPCDSLT